MEKHWCCYPVVEDCLQMRKITEPSSLTRRFTHSCALLCHNRHGQHIRQTDRSSSWSNVGNIWPHSHIPVSCKGHSCSAVTPLGVLTLHKSVWWFLALVSTPPLPRFPIQIAKYVYSLRHQSSPLGSIPCSPCACLPPGDPHSPPSTAQRAGRCTLSGYRNGDLRLLENVIATERSEERYVVKHLSPPLKEVSHMHLIQRRDVWDCSWRGVLATRYQIIEGSYLQSWSGVWAWHMAKIFWQTPIFSVGLGFFSPFSSLDFSLWKHSLRCLILLFYRTEQLRCPRGLIVYSLRRGLPQRIPPFFSQHLPH